ncbi:N-acetyltransferase family protein [Alistipes sp.]|uniref:GNAT family N-acetyltransferase n=1 Tax=Alistipes sp. TaxID=1872444 RepID=UPI003AF1A6FE
MKELEFREAVAADLPQILRIIAQAKAQMRALGSTQWQDGYPAEADIRRDLRLGYGYVLVRAAAPDRPIAYGAVVFDGEAAYAGIAGSWLTEGPYVVVHRLAVADGEKGRGAATAFMRRTEALARARGVRAFRIDTNFDNRYMLRMLSRLGFAYCGKIRYESGERLAFEKRL